MRGILISSILFFILSLNFSHAQESNESSYFGKRFFVNPTGGYFPHFDNNNAINEKFHEGFLSIQTGMSLTKNLYSGVQAMAVFNSGTHISSDAYLIPGIFFRYDFFVKSKFNWFVENAFSYSEYCVCETIHPYRHPNLFVISLGIGIEASFIDNIGFHISVFPTLILKNGNETYWNWSYYRIGLTFRFGKKMEPRL